LAEASTIWSAGTSTTSSTTTIGPGSCGAGTATTTAQTVWFAGTSSATCAATSEFVEKIVFSATVTPGSTSTSYADTWVVQTGTGASATYVASSYGTSMTPGVTTSTTLTVTLYVDLGSTTSTAVVLDSVDVTVSGS
jgi:hypothetical protein